MVKALLALENGHCFQGVSIGASGSTCGELVFNTAMTGYQEVLTDPSYHQQMVAFTASHIGNTGCNEEDIESNGHGPLGVVLRQPVIEVPHWRATVLFPEYLKRRGLLGIAGVDTRYLTQMLREEGALRACLQAGEAIDAKEAVAKAQQCPSLLGQDLVQAVTCKTPYDWSQGLWPHAQMQAPSHGTVVVMDFGVKFSLLRHMAAQGFAVKVVPASSSAQEVLAYEPVGILLSNGPGDPSACTSVIETIAELIPSGVPILGVCLGFQLLLLALGAKTCKMKFGHHGINHPVLDVRENRVFITSQNHGFMLDTAMVPDALTITHRSLFDNTAQGFQHASLPVSGLQGHPEAGPGPNEWSHALRQWGQQCKERARAQA